MPYPFKPLDRQTPAWPIYIQVGSGRSKHKRGGNSGIVAEYIEHIGDGISRVCSKFTTKRDWSLNIQQVDLINQGSWLEVGWVINVVPLIPTVTSEKAITDIALSFAVKLYDVAHRLPVIIVANKTYNLREEDIEEIRNSAYYE